MKQAFLLLLPLVVLAFGCERHEPESLPAHVRHGSASHGAAASHEPAAKEKKETAAKEKAPVPSGPAPKFFESKPAK